MKEIEARILKGIILSSIVGLGAREKKSLSSSGVAGAVIVGTSCFAFGGPLFYSALLAFFGTGSLLSHYRKQEKEGFEFEKGGERDIYQVLANGGVGALSAILYFLSGKDPLYLNGFLGSMAAVTADTWATEIGVLSGDDPVHLITGKKVPKGTSGAITPLGNGAAIAGALLSGIVAAFQKDSRFSTASLLLGSLFGGLSGAWIDSLLGATVQAQYFCPRCNKMTEKKLHRCGTRTHLKSGIPWITNDVVNLMCSLTGAAVSALFYHVLKEYDKNAGELEYYFTL